MTDYSQYINQLSLDERIQLEARILAHHADNREPHIPSREDLDPAPLSFSQERLWFLAQLEPDSSAYNETHALRVTGTLDIRALELSLDALAQRHDSLRVCFREVDGRMSQITDPIPTTHIPIHDLTYLQAGSQEAATNQEVESIRAKRFDLTQAPLWRVALLKLADDDYVFVRVVHHIVTDGWSGQIFWSELSHFYAGFAVGTSVPSLPELPISYVDFSIWQRSFLQGSRLDRMSAYWKAQLADLQPLDLPADFPRPPRSSSRGSHEEFFLDQVSTDSLSALARQSGTTLYILLLAAFQILLYRHCGQNKIAVGSPIANRTRTEVEGLHGFFANTLVMYADCGGSPSFRTFLSQVHTHAMNAFAHQELPFEKLVEEMIPDRKLNRNPLFDVLFAFQNTPRSEPELPGLECQRVDFPTHTSKFDLSLHMRNRGADFVGRIEYATDLFKATTIRRMIGHFQTLLQAVIADPDCPITDLPLLTEDERRQILVDWADTTSVTPPDTSIHRLIEDQVERTPESPAIEMDGMLVSYAELNGRANQLARLLRERGVSANSSVALFARPGMSTIVALLAILKAGGVYVPFDADHPAERLSWMIRHVDPVAFLLQDGDDQSILPDGIRSVRIHIDQTSAQTQTRENLPLIATVNDVAYILFTSGSTGQPKAVTVPHRTLTNLMSWQQQHPRLGKPARTLQYASMTFDVSLQEILSTWTTGGTLVLPSQQLRFDPNLLLDYISEKKIERMHMPYVLLQALADTAGERDFNPDSLLDIVSAGEALHLTPAIRTMMTALPVCRLHNHYGPTEAHVVTTHSLDGDIDAWPSESPIGKPIDNTQIYLLDNHAQPVPIGVPGELHIGGAALALGYLQRSDLTAEHFIHNPFSDEPDSRLYRTGDLARFRDDGTIDFLGRIDRQVKIRGFRVEPGEIEASMRSHPAVLDSVVDILEDDSNEKRLVAWWVPRPGAVLDEGELRSFLRLRLPSYMLPTTLVSIDRLPLTSSGKIDRRALPVPDLSGLALDKSFVAPCTPTEKDLADIWSSLLGLNQVGIHDNFFELGGHSLKATQVVSRIRRTFQIALPLFIFFEHPTIAELAEHLDTVQWMKQSNSRTLSTESEEGEL